MIDTIENYTTKSVCRQLSSALIHFLAVCIGFIQRPKLHCANIEYIVCVNLVIRQWVIGALRASGSVREHSNIISPCFGILDRIWLSHTRGWPPSSGAWYNELIISRSLPWSPTSCHDPQHLCEDHWENWILPFIGSSLRQTPARTKTAESLRLCFRTK